MRSSCAAAVLSITELLALPSAFARRHYEKIQRDGRKFREVARRKRNGQTGVRKFPRQQVRPKTFGESSDDFPCSSETMSITVW